MKHFIHIFMLTALITLMGHTIIIPAPAHASPRAEAFSFSSSPNRSISDYSGGPRSTSDSISIDQPIQIDDLKVYIYAKHTAVGDLVLTLTHGTTSVILMDRPGVPASSKGCTQNNVNATFTDSATKVVETMCYGAPAIRNNVLPEYPLDAFDGELTEGEWILTITDHRSSNTGTFKSWELLIEGHLLEPDVSPAGIGSYGCTSGTMTVDYEIVDLPAGTYRYIAGAWLIDIDPGGDQQGGHLMWREWTATTTGGTETVSMPLTETFDATTSGLVVRPLNWTASFGGPSIPANSHIRFFYQVWSEDFGQLFGSGEFVAPSCAG